MVQEFQDQGAVSVRVLLLESSTEFRGIKRHHIAKQIQASLILFPFPANVFMVSILMTSYNVVTSSESQL